ncbi:unnamed protein product [Euphydryas editha]|uniref:SWIM-type domain-containing protein n=1 Tax=Euphydryas editha TaxID=104508 RepID=A0AAU9U583_EUPED|nr:unnamed protein product [Euphydryas editha]
METGRRCVLCPRSILRQRRHILQNTLPQRRPDLAEYIVQNGLVQVVFNNVMATCHRCWQRANNSVDHRARDQVNVANDLELLEEPAPEPMDISSADQQEAEIFMPDHVRTPNSSRRCIYRACRSENLRRIPASIKLYGICNYRLYMSPSARLCEDHLMHLRWEELLDSVNVTHYFNSRLITDMTNMLIQAVNNTSRLDFESPMGLDENELHFWTGLRSEQFNNILEETPSLSQRKRPRTVLGIYLTKLRTGETNERLATLFNMSRSQLQRNLKEARVCLTQDFVIRHLGIDHITRDNVLDRNLLIPKQIFGNEANTKAILICDGTYIYIEKSANFSFQRVSYSHHKFRNLLKPFLIVCSDGYIIDVLGPYPATTSDALIMKSIMNNEEHPLHVFLNHGDVFNLDRGFRDSIDDIEACGYEAHMPPSKDRNATQLTTEQANKSRLVTICRWVVEAVNGKFKNRFNLLRQKYFNKTLPNVFTDFKIAAAIINAYYHVATDNEHAPEILDIIHTQMNTPNLLNDYVHMKNLNRQRVAFVPMEANIPQLEDFPRLSEHDVFLFALGSYHIKLAKSYCAEHLRDGLYHIELYRQTELSDLHLCNIHQRNVWLVRVRTQSRHVRSRIYYSYILINRDAFDRNSIAYWYCTCLTGNRTVGSCAHIISIVWYMGLGRYINFNPPAEMLDNIFIDAE